MTANSNNICDTSIYIGKAEEFKSFEELKKGGIYKIYYDNISPGYCLKSETPQTISRLNPLDTFSIQDPYPEGFDIYVFEDEIILYEEYSSKEVSLEQGSLIMVLQPAWEAQAESYIDSETLVDVVKMKLFVFATGQTITLTKHKIGSMQYLYKEVFQEGIK